ncbi:phosphotransferase-like protein [Arthrobacter livingstonensis]|uniref:phosphotransferase-like protein n=1 Tax=Arthrobacter livingstonensis TaxID=670078 RepID=UPI002482361C|nr:hypothetical protein [Arthrobacter livingstonensis]
MLALERSWHTGLRSMARAGAPVILDEVPLSWGAGQERLRSAFNDVELIWVAARGDPGVAIFREARRVDRVEGLARQPALSVRGGVAYDVEVYATHSSTEGYARDMARQLSLDAFVS